MATDDYVNPPPDWSDEAVRLAKEVLDKDPTDVRGALRAASEYEGFFPSSFVKLAQSVAFDNGYNTAIEKAARAMTPVIRSMISRGEAARKIRELAKK